MSVQRGGLLAFLTETGEIKEELNVSMDEALRIQRERADQRMQLDQAAADVIVEKVATQMQCTPDEAKRHMEYWDRVAVETFSVDNDFPRSELH
jgi:regulator of replication initiation timing